jgi:hypothetical protein
MSVTPLGIKSCGAKNVLLSVIGIAVNVLLYKVGQR